MFDNDSIEYQPRHSEQTVDRPVSVEGNGRTHVKAGMGNELVDMFARTITYLRVSLTDHCNLRCLYCTPKDGQAKLPVSELLTYEELLRVISIAVKAGIKKVRLTGGEPLVRREVISFIDKLAAMPGLDDIRLTTNGVRLPEYAEALYNSGIRKLNISLDTLKRERYKQITGFDCFAKVWKGIEVAEHLGFKPLKINMVVLRGINDDELVDFAKLSVDRPFQVRFIEFMPVGKSSPWEKGKYMSMSDMIERMRDFGELVPVERDRSDGPAKIYKIAGGRGTLGFISPISSHFCDRCNRLRLTSEGRMRSCLLCDREFDLKKLLRGGCSDDEVRALLYETVLNKPKGHELDKDHPGNCHGRMSRIGG